MEQDGLGEHERGGAGVDAVVRGREPRQEASGQRAGACLRLADAGLQPFPSSSARSSATFAASIEREIRTPGKASSIAARSSVSFAG